MNESFDVDETLDVELTDSFVFDIRKISDQIRREAEERTTTRPDPLRDATRFRDCPIAKTTWTQRVLAWFRRA